MEALSQQTETSLQVGTPAIRFPDGTPADTQAAISDRVKLVHAMSAEQRAQIGVKYTNPEALFEALGQHVDGQPCTQLLRASWLKGLDPASGDRLPKRGVRLPPEAIITVTEVREIQSKSKAKFALPVLALSYYCLLYTSPSPRDS